MTDQFRYQKQIALGIEKYYKSSRYFSDLTLKDLYKEYRQASNRKKLFNNLKWWTVLLLWLIIPTILIKILVSLDEDNNYLEFYQTSGLVTIIVLSFLFGGFFLRKVHDIEEEDIEPYYNAKLLAIHSFIAKMEEEEQEKADREFEERQEKKN